jgi:hypothetical protein
MTIQGLEQKTGGLTKLKNYQVLGDDVPEGGTCFELWTQLLLLRFICNQIPSRLNFPFSCNNLSDCNITKNCDFAAG